MNPIWPSIAGQHAGFLAKQLHDFKSGNRADPTMGPMAMPLSDTDIADLSAFFATQTAKIGEADADKVELGQAIYRAGNSKSGVSACSACHGPSGKGNPQANFPALSGQNAAYVTQSLEKFASGERNNDASAMMRDIAGLGTRSIN